MTTKTYPLPDPAAVAQKVAAAGGPQVDVSKPVGTAQGDGVSVGWTIEQGSITIVILHKPFWMPENTIWSHIDPIFA